MTRRKVSRILIARSIVELEVVFGEKHGPTSLTTIEEMRRHKIFEVFMVRDDSDRVGGADEPGTHITESVDNGEEFFVMDFIINFGRGEFARV